MTELNSRVGAIIGTNGMAVDFLGYGVYEGDLDPRDAVNAPLPVGFTAELMIGSNMKNPRIKLDNGSVVWGCECWWGPEEEIKKRLAAYEGAGYTVRTINMDNIRKNLSDKQKRDKKQ